MYRYFILLFSFLFFFSVYSAGVDSKTEKFLTEKYKDIYSIESLGFQVNHLNLMSSCFGKDKDNNTKIYLGIMGQPAQFVIIDEQTNKAEKYFPLEDCTAVYDMLLSKSGDVYIATVPKGFLFKYDIKKSELINLGLCAKDVSFIWELEESNDGKIYGACYPKSKLFSYDPKENKFTDHGSIAVGEDYCRCLAYDKNKDILYVGIGSHANLVKIDLKTFEKKEILPEEYKKSHFVYYASISGGKLFIKLDPSSELLIMDIETETIDSLLPVSSTKNVSLPINDSKEVFYMGGGNLFKYDIEKKTNVQTDFKNNSSPTSFKWEDENNFKSVLTNGNLLRYNTKTGKFKTVKINVEGQPINIHNLFYGPDKKIYTSGYVVGQAGVFDPKDSSRIQIGGLKQAEGITSLGNTIYFGTYPGAVYSVLDTSKKVGRDNPKVIFKLDKEEQDRPFTMLAVPELNKVFSGTTPGYGLLGGCLAEYDIASDKYEAYRNVIKNQSLSSLAYKDKILYCGTTISGGLGIVPTEKTGKFFMWDILNKKLIKEFTPAEGAQIISGLQVDDEGNIWGWAEENLFVFNPKKEEFIFNKKMFETREKSGQIWRDCYMSNLRDGKFYCVHFGKLFTLDIKTKEIDIIAEKMGLNIIAFDDEGRLYFADKDTLYRLNKK